MKYTFQDKDYDVSWKYDFEKHGTLEAWQTPKVTTTCCIERSGDDHDRNSYIGIALCSPKDQHKKDTARMVSLSRACEVFSLATKVPHKDVKEAFFNQYFKRKEKVQCPTSQS